MIPLQTVNSTFHEALYYGTYRLDKTSQKYELGMERKISRTAKSLDISMNMQHFNPSDSVTVLSFLLTLKSSGDPNGVHEGTVVQIFIYFMKYPTQGRAHSCTTHKSKNLRTGLKETSKFSTVIHLLKNYATYDIISTAENYLLKISQPNRISEE